MEISSILGILLFILPGILAAKISYKMDFPTGKKRNDFIEAINGIALSFPILLIVTFYIQQKHGLRSISELAARMDDIDYLLKTCVYILIVSILAGIVFLPIKVFIRWIVNLFRVKILKKMKTDDKSCWRKFTVDKNRSRYMKVLKDGKEYSGFVYSYSLPDEELEIILENPENIEDYPEAMELLNRINLTYINIEKGVVIEDYDTEKFFAKIDELSKKN